MKGNFKKVWGMGMEFRSLLMGINTQASGKMVINMGKELITQPWKRKHTKAALKKDIVREKEKFFTDREIYSKEHGTEMKNRGKALSYSLTEMCSKGTGKTIPFVAFAVSVIKMVITL